jgi:hypothetical protein
MLRDTAVLSAPTTFRTGASLKRDLLKDESRLLIRQHYSNRPCSLVSSSAESIMKQSINPQIHVSHALSNNSKCHVYSRIPELT